MSNSCLSQAAQCPILLDKNHHLTRLIVVDAHFRIMHDRVKEIHRTEIRVLVGEGMPICQKSNPHMCHL